MQFTFVNTMSFSERLSRLLKEKSLSANELSKIIEVQRSTLSHLISGRNKPSLDLIERFYIAFPDIRLEWLILGKGAMYMPVESAINTLQVPQHSQQLAFQEPQDEIIPEEKAPEPQGTVSETLIPKENVVPVSEDITQKQAVRSIIFFNDGSFEIYHNSQL